MGTEPNSPAASRIGAGRRLVTTGNAKGAPVYAPDGNKLGRVEGVMEDEATGEIVYAIVNFSPGKGIGFETNEYPVPWSLLRYNSRFGGYEVKIASSPISRSR